MPQDATSEFIQKYLAGKDVFEARSMFSDFVSHWLGRAGIRPELQEKAMGRIMRPANNLIVNPGVYSGDRKSMLEQGKLEYGAISTFKNLLQHVGNVPEDDVARTANVFENFMKSIREFAPNDVPLFQMDPDDASKTVNMNQSLKRYVDKIGVEDISIKDLGNNLYEFSAITPEGEMPLGQFVLANGQEAEMAAGRLRQVSKEMSHLSGSKTPEAKGRMLQLITGDPIGFAPSSGAAEMSSENVDAMRRAGQASAAVDAAVRDLGVILQGMSEVAARMRTSAPNADLTSVMTSLYEVLDDLSQSSMALGQMSMGQGALNLDQFATSWRRLKKLARMLDETQEVEHLIKRALDVLSNLVFEIQSNTQHSFAKKSSWKRQAAVPMGLTPDAEIAPPSVPEAAPAPAMPPQQVVEPDQNERLLRWETSLAVGAANRGVKFLQSLLKDQSFWSRFMVPDEPAVPDTVDPDLTPL